MKKFSANGFATHGHKYWSFGKNWTVVDYVSWIKNFIRAQTRTYPSAYTIVHDKKVIIWDAHIVSDLK